MDPKRTPIVAYPIHTLQKKKGKYYACVQLPDAVRHLHSEPRIRISTGECDLRHAELVARDTSVPEIHRRIDILFDRLDPVVEGFRDILESKGFAVSEWYKERRITFAIRPSGFIPAKYAKKYDVTDHAKDYIGLCYLISQLGFAIPKSVVELLNGDDAKRLHELSQHQTANPEAITVLLKGHDVLDPEVQKALHFVVDPSPVLSLGDGCGNQLYSSLAEELIEKKKNKDSKDVQGKRRNSAAMFIKVNGDKPIGEYDKLHMIEMARFMDEEGKGNATIKNYVSYTKQVFDHAETVRGPNGSPLLPSHPMHEFRLAEYGKKAQSYLPLNKDDLLRLFGSEINKEDRLLLSILVATGMRLDEGALMTFEQLTEHEGLLCFSLVDEDVKVKNIQSKRYIPVPDIIRPMLGNLGKGRLFSYRMDDEGKAEQAASKALMKHIRKVTTNPRKAVHSLRGTLKDLLRDAGISKEINDFMTGHAQGDVAGGRYGKGPSIPVRKEALDSVKHPWLGK